MTITNPIEPITDDGEVRHSDAIELVAFLARSEHRIRVLSLLDDGVRSRDELGEAVGATRVTLSRVLGDLEDRGLIARYPAENAYELTRFGELVYRDIARLLGTVSVGKAFPDVVERLPTDWFDFDLQALADGELVADEGGDLMSAARDVADAVQEASSRRALLGTFLSLPLYSFEEALRAGDAPDGAVVFDADVADTWLSDANLRERWQTVESIAESPVYYRVDESVPCAVSLIDGDTVFLTIDGDRQNDFDVIECTHPDVVAWADTVTDEYLEKATPLRECVADEV